MSLFTWSTPERHRADQTSLPIIPNEIYIYIFEFTAPPTGRLTKGELEIFAHLSSVCRFFANICLPRIIEFVEFHYPSMFYHPNREAVLCTQIAAKQPLALSLAKRVRSCHFAKGLFFNVGSIARKCLAGMLHMKNICQLKFSSSFVDAEFWSAIPTLESLEELSFEGCRFLHGPADVEPEEMVKVSHLQVIDCSGHFRPVEAMHPEYLRTLVVDSLFFDQVDWLPQSGLTELRLYLYLRHSYQVEQVHTLLTQVPQSLEALWLFVCVKTAEARDMVRRIFADPTWKNLSLRSLTACHLFGSRET